ncbi:MAG: C4-type zinc ribbon domain-containing protein [Verrucomicrobiota bacterium]|jgi:hypothetical protein
MARLPAAPNYGYGRIIAPVGADGFSLQNFAKYEITITHGFMNELLQNLIRLQSLEFGEIKGKNAEATIAELRGKIPPQILAHYDRLVAKGKKGVAAVRNQVCTGCHMRVPIGVVTTLMHDTDIQLCESCGRYLHLSDSTTTKAPEGTAKPKPARKTRSPKSSSQLISTPDPPMSLAIDELGQGKMRPSLRSNPN